METSINELHEEALEYDTARSQVFEDLDNYYEQVIHGSEISPDLSIDYEGLDLKRFMQDPGVIIKAIKSFALRDISYGWDMTGTEEVIRMGGRKRVNELPKGVLYLSDIDMDFFGNEECVIKLLKEVGTSSRYWVDDVSGPASYISPELRLSKKFFNRLVNMAREGYNLYSTFFIYIHPRRIDKEILKGYEEILGDYSCYPYLFRMSYEEMTELYENDKEFFIEFVRKVFKIYRKRQDEELICDFERYRRIDDDFDFLFSCNGYKPHHPKQWIDVEKFKKLVESGLDSLKGIPLELILQDTDSADEVVDRGIDKGYQNMTAILSEEMIEGCPDIVNKFLAVNPENFFNLPKKAQNSRYTQASIFKVWPGVIKYLPEFQGDFVDFVIGRDCSNPDELQKFAERILPKEYISRLDKEDKKYFVDMKRYNIEQMKSKNSKES